jgi:hypothetical protein
MEGHAAMDMSVGEGTLAEKIFSARGFTAISHHVVMDWAATTGETSRSSSRTLAFAAKHTSA